MRGAVCCVRSGAPILSVCRSKWAAPGTDPASQRPPSQRESCEGSVRQCCSTCGVRYVCVERGTCGARAPASLPAGRAALRRTATFGAQEAGYTCTRVQAHDCGRFVNTAQCNLTSLSRDLTTSGSFEGWPASFEATASNPAAASRLTGDAAAPSARIVATLDHMGDTYANTYPATRVRLHDEVDKRAGTRSFHRDLHVRLMRTRTLDGRTMRSYRLWLVFPLVHLGPSRARR